MSKRKREKIDCPNSDCERTLTKGEDINYCVKCGEELPSDDVTTNVFEDMIGLIIYGGSIVLGMVLLYLYYFTFVA